MASTVTAVGAQDRSQRWRRIVSSTPGRLRVESVLIIAAALVAGLLANLVVADHVAGTRRIATVSEPVIVSARQVQTSLAEANAAAATSFLAGGVENPAQRRTYEAALESAALELERATRLVGDGEEADTALGLMTARIPRYAGLIETARANNRQGFPVGAAYLNSATTLLETEIYPATDLVANRAAEEYRQSYDRQRGLALVVGIVAVALVATVVVILAYTQLQLRRRFNRLLNPPLVVATIVALALTGWMIYALAGQTSHLTAARTDGYEGTRLYLDIRGRGFGARADEARFLIARGAGEQFEQDFARRASQIEELRAPLEAHAADSAARGEAQRLASETYDAWAAYASTHTGLVEADRAGERDIAVDTAVGPSTEAFTRFDEASEAGLDAAERVFADEMAQAERSMRGLQVGSIAAVALVAILAAYGLQLRINEYR